MQIQLTGATAGSSTLGASTSATTGASGVGSTALTSSTGAAGVATTSGADIIAERDVSWRDRDVKRGRKDRTKKTYVERELIARERESCVLRRLWAERENRKEGIESYSNLDAASFYLLQSVYALFGREPYFQGRRYVPYFSIPSSRP